MRVRFVVSKDFPSLNLGPDGKFVESTTYIDAGRVIEIDTFHKEPDVYFLKFQDGSHVAAFESDFEFSDPPTNQLSSSPCCQHK
jgi:hypothetical protein